MATSIYVDGAYAGYGARDDVARVAGQYGMLVVARRAGDRRAGAPGHGPGGRHPDPRHRFPTAPIGRRPRTPNFDNASMSNFGCGVNSNLAAMVANPQDLVHGREGSGVGDSGTAAKAVDIYRKAVPTGQGGLKDISTKGN